MRNACKKKCKTVRAGRQVRQIIYPVPFSSDPPKTRAGKKAASREAQRLLNRRYTYEKAQDLIAENFDVGDIFLPSPTTRRTIRPAGRRRKRTPCGWWRRYERCGAHSIGRIRSSSG